MLFNSFPFIFVYLPVVFAGTFLLGRRHPRLAAFWLGLASLVFYAAWDSRFLGLLVGSVLFNYGAGYWLDRLRTAGAAAAAKRCLAAAISVDLLVLCYFKYANFFVASLSTIFGIPSTFFDVVLPLGISFFTFTQIAFLVDVYRGIAKERSFIDYLLFVTYFPHLIAGPVLHHKEMMPQFARADTWRIQPNLVAAGVSIFVAGLVKKVMLADSFADFATPIFDSARDGGSMMLVESWIGALAYTLQLYFDFSGYSDMAVGLSLMLNIRLPINFYSPYKASSIVDFWRRWHMTLSAFLRDYLYIPLGGNRKGPARRYVNLMLTMLIGGLWHGAGWTFVAWGGLHGLYLIVNHGWNELGQCMHWTGGGRIARLAGGSLTFLAVVVAWVFFRAETFGAAWNILRGMLGANGISLPGALQGNLASFNESILHIKFIFDGLTPVTNIDPRPALQYLAVGLGWVWLLPNLQQIFAAWQPTLGISSSMKRELPNSQKPEPGCIQWNPAAIPAMATGVLFVGCLLCMCARKATEFLYYQF